jgi:hypothetical protein
MSRPQDSGPASAGTRLRLVSVVIATAALATAAGGQATAFASAAAGKPATARVTVPEPTGQTTIPAPRAHPGGPGSNGCGRSPSGYAWIGAGAGMALSAQIKATSSTQEVRAAYAMTDDTTGTAIPHPAGSNAVGTGPGHFSLWVAGSGVTNTPLNFSPADGHTYSWKTKSEATTGQYSLWAATCGFRTDLTPPAQPATGSKAFPPVGTHAAPVTGTFHFTSSDPVPSCTGCQASGVYDFEYALNQPLPANPLTPGCGHGDQASGVAVLATTSQGTATATSCPVTAQWGSNTLYVEAIDYAGNVAQSTYTFYVPAT